MWAYRVVEWGRPAELVEVPLPRPGPGQVLVRVAGCGLCHSDLTMVSMDGGIGEALGWQVPFTLGHETAGWIEDVGPGVDLGPELDVGPGPSGHGTGLVEGSTVALVSPSSCGACRWCLRGQENACPNGLVGRGYGRDGGLAEYVLVDDPVRSLVPLGSMDPVLAGPLTDAGATSYHAVRRVLPHLSDDSAVVVVGIGGLGSFVVQILRALAPTSVCIVAVDLDRARLDRARALGADAAVVGVERGTGRAVAAAVDGVGPGLGESSNGHDEPGDGGGTDLGARSIDAVVDVVGTDETIAMGARLLAPGGVLAVVGAAGGTLRRPWFGALPRDGQVLTFQGSDLADVRGVLELAERGLVTVDVDRFPLTAVADAYEAMEAGALRGRAVVTP